MTALNLIASVDPGTGTGGDASQTVFGNINNPLASGYGDLTKSGNNAGLIGLVNNLVALITVLAGLFVLVNFVLAGYIYLSANGQPQKIAEAGNKILQSVIGLAIVAAAYIIAALIGKILFNNPDIFLQPQLFSL